MNIKLVNDFSERGVVIIQNYNNILMQNEDGKQYILQNVEGHRKRFPGSQKSNII